MGLDEFFSPRVLIVVGKGGVGKTTVSSALALLAARTGRKALIVEVEGKSGLPNLFGAPELGYLAQEVAEGVSALTLTPEDALVDYFHDHNMGRLSRRLARSNVIDYVATAVPGLRDIIVLGKIKQIANTDGYDTVVVDSPAAGHAVVFLTGAKGILDAVRVGPIRDQARDVLELLEDHTRCRVPLVTLAEETPVNETVETAQRLRERLDLSLGPIVVNAWVEPSVEPAPATTAVEALASTAGAELPPALAGGLAAAAQFRAARRWLQEKQAARLSGMTDLPMVRLPYCFSAGFGPPELGRLADGLEAQLARAGSRT